MRSFATDRVFLPGGIAQLVEHLTGSQGVRGSNPLTSTKEVLVDGLVSIQVGIELLKQMAREVIHADPRVVYFFSLAT